MARAGGVAIVMALAVCGCASSGNFGNNSADLVHSAAASSVQGRDILVASASYGAREATPGTSISYPCDAEAFRATRMARKAARVFDVFPRQKFEKALKEINSYRRANGLQPLEIDWQLGNIAEKHLRDLAQQDLVSHSGTDGSTLGQRLRRDGYMARLAAENLSGGHDTYHDAVHAWIDSPGHRKNLLLADVSVIGMAAVYDENSRYGTFWAMVLAKPMDQEDLRVARWK